MMLHWLIILPVAGGLLAWILAKWNPLIARWATLAAIAATAALALSFWPHSEHEAYSRAEWAISWIPMLGINFALALDGLSLLLILLSLVITLLAVLVSWNGIVERVGAFHLNVLLILAGATGVFLSDDLFLFFFCWELMVVPMAFLIALWGGSRRVYAATKFFIFTQASGLLMLVSILGLVFASFSATGVITFSYPDLLGTNLDPRLALLLMSGFFLAFAVKLPIAPFHAWQADAYTEAPIGGTLILAGFLSKTGGYGLIRFGIPLFPDAALEFAPWAIGLGIFTVVYGAMLAFAQRDAKRMVAFSSLSHMGFIVIGAFAWNIYGLQGALIFMLSHGLATSALFILVDRMEVRLGHRRLDEMGGIARLAPRFAGFTLFFVLASLGLPATGNFVGEFLILLSAFENHRLLAGLACAAIIFPAVYSLYLVQRALHGPAREGLSFPELKIRESVLLALMILGTLWIGLRPQGLLDTSHSTLVHIRDTSLQPVIHTRPSYAEAPHHDHGPR